MDQFKKAVKELVQSSQHLASTEQDSSERRTRSADYARILLGCYRTGEVSDPQVFTAAVVAVLSRFPEAVARAVCDPVSGLPSKSKWLPTTSEILTACNDEQRHQETVARYAAMKREPAAVARSPGPSPGQDYFTLFEAHGRPNGPFEQGRQLQYGG